MAEQVHHKKTEKIQESEGDSEADQEPSRTDDPDWTPGPGDETSRRSHTDPGNPSSSYNLRRTIYQRTWDGQDYLSEPVDRYSTRKGFSDQRGTPPDTPSGIPKSQTARRLFGNVRGPDTRPQLAQGNGGGDSRQGSETPTQVHSDYPRDSRRARSTQVVCPTGSADCAQHTHSNTSSSLFLVGNIGSQARNMASAALSASKVFGNKEEWSRTLWGQWAELEKKGVEEAVPILSSFASRFGCLGEDEVQKLNLSTARAKLLKDLDKKSLVEKIPPDDLISTITGLIQEYEELWSDRTDITKALNQFKGIGFTTLSQLELIKDVIELATEAPAEKVFELEPKLADKMPQCHALGDFADRWNTAFSGLIVVKSETLPDESTMVTNHQNVLGSTGASSVIGGFKSGLTFGLQGARTALETTAAGAATSASSTTQQGSSGTAATPAAAAGPSASQPSSTNPLGATGSGGSGTPNRPVFCALCFRPGHTAETCPGKPDENKGPYCMNCKKMGHSFYQCPQGRFAVPCNHCGDVGHFDKDCPFEKARQRRLAQREPKTYQEVRLLAKAGMPLESDDRDSDIEEIPREDPQDVLKRQMKERKRLEAERQVRKLQKEEERLTNMQWADLYRIKDDLMILLSGKDKATEADLSAAQQRELNQALINAYIQQQAKGARALDQGSSVAASLKDLGIDGLYQYDGNEAKYPVKSFIRQVDEVKGFKKWPNPTAAIAMSKLLVGNAKDWYEVLRADNNQETPEYHKLKLALLQQFYKKITIVEKALAMTALKFDVAKHGSHLNFLTECERQAFIISDEAYSLEADEELITRRQAREEQTLLIFVAHSAPLLRWEIEYHGAETKAEIKTVIRRFENALRAKENSPRHALIPGYKVNEVSVPDGASIQKQMEAWGYSPAEVNAVARNKPPRNGNSEVVQCYYCATVGHRRNECGQLEEDRRKGQVKPDKAGPRAGQPPQVESLSKKKGGAKDKKPKSSTPATGTKKKKTFFRKKKVNAVEATDSEEDSDEDEGDDEEITGPRSSAKVAAVTPSRAPGTPWSPWGGPYPGAPGWPPFGATNVPALESPQTAEVSLRPQKRSPYDLI